ncbi:MAG TPA: dienelactone hydrolase family protein [Planctomycetaceae bacterium]|nr:dienelactone hydrolase family protein [Planctomycetaceae bacterium]
MTLHFSSDFWLRRGGQISDLLPAGRAGFPDCDESDESDEAALARREARAAQDDPEPRVELLSESDDAGAVYVPERYEPNYAYPLLVWLHNGGAGRRELMSLMSRVSTQNYLAVLVACREYPAPLPQGAAGGVVDLIDATLRSVRRRYHAHTERVYPIGFGNGASLALALVLERPELFGGGIALCGRFPDSKQPLFRFRELNRKPVLLAGGAKDERVPVAEVVRAGRLLHAAGLSVTTRVYDAGHEMTPRMLRDVDRWVMGGIGAARV